jgi:hypothetical protein
MNRFNELFASSRYLESGDEGEPGYGCPTCGGGREKTMYGISDGTDYELLKLDRAISAEFGGNETYTTAYPGAIGPMGPRPPSSFQLARFNSGEAKAKPALVYGAAVAVVALWAWKSWQR